MINKSEPNPILLINNPTFMNMVRCFRTLEKRITDGNERSQHYKIIFMGLII